jgi:hypothetical protein
MSADKLIYHHLDGKRSRPGVYLGKPPNSNGHLRCECGHRADWHTSQVGWQAGSHARGIEQAGDCSGLASKKQELLADMQGLDNPDLCHCEGFVAEESVSLPVQFEVGQTVRIQYEGKVIDLLGDND